MSDLTVKEAIARIESQIERLKETAAVLRAVDAMPLLPPPPAAATPPEPASKGLLPLVSEAVAGTASRSHSAATIPAKAVAKRLLKEANREMHVDELFDEVRKIVGDGRIQKASLPATLSRLKAEGVRSLGRGMYEYNKAEDPDAAIAESVK